MKRHGSSGFTMPAGLDNGEPAFEPARRLGVVAATRSG
jgi:hypothetical protein